MKAVRPERLGEFEVLYQTHKDKAYRVALALCREQPLAEDAVSDAFFNVYPHWVTGRIENFEWYLLKTVRNQVNAALRHRVIERREEERHRVELNLASAEAGAVDRDALRRALGWLPKQEGEVLVLRYFADLSVAETAKMLEVSEGTVKSAASRGLAKLKGAVPQLGLR